MKGCIKSLYNQSPGFNKYISKTHIGVQCRGWQTHILILVADPKQILHNYPRSTLEKILQKLKKKEISGHASIYWSLIINVDNNVHLV